MIIIIDWMFVSPKNSHFEAFPNVMAFGGGAFGEWLGKEGRVHMNETEALTEVPESSLFQRPCEEPGRRPLLNILPAGDLTLNFPMPRTVKNKCLKTSCLW